MLHHLGTIPIETPRLLLRQFRIEDAKDMFDNWAGREEVTRYMAWPPHQNVRMTRERIEQWCAQYGNPAVYHWAIIFKDNGQAVGSVSVQALRERQLSCEIGYCLGNDYWNRGLMTEALRAALHFLFEKIGFRRVQGLHRENNPASGRVMEKAGMTYEGTLREFQCDRDGIWHSLCIYSVLRSEWTVAVRMGRD